MADSRGFHSSGGDGRAQTLAGLILSQTDGGRDIVERMVDFMYGRVEGCRVSDSLSAAKELMDRAWGRPSAASPVAAEDASEGAEDAADTLRQMIMAALSAETERGEP